MEHPAPSQAPRVMMLPAQDRDAALADVSPDLLGRIGALVRDRHGLDLSCYRPATIARRIRSAMIAADARVPAAYLALLRDDPHESERLLARLTIKVSRFYRDATAFAAAEAALRARLAAAPGPVSIWSAGCARGEEPWSLAIVLAELGAPAGATPEVLATDVDHHALAAAERGAYAADALEELPDALRERHLARTGPPAEPYLISAALRPRVRFQAHDLTRDLAPGRFGLVACRNALIYFTPETQRRAFAELWRAVSPGGLLWLGESEWPAPLQGPPDLRVVDRRARLFRRIDRGASS
jgi:chemotaxis methyl-accepting protein methylase